MKSTVEQLSPTRVKLSTSREFHSTSYLGGHTYRTLAS